jgi:hypothetical protein
MTPEGDDSDGGDLEEVGSSQHTDIDEYSEFFATPPTRRPDGSGQTGEALGSSSAEGSGQTGEALGSSSAEGAESARRPRSRTPSPVRSESAAKRQKRVTWAEHRMHDGEGGRAAQQDKRQRDAPASNGNPGPSTKVTKAQDAAGSTQQEAKEIVERVMSNATLATPMNCYRVLGVEKDATAEAIKRSFRAASLRIHPDKCRATQAAAAFQCLNEAFETLSDAHRRREHDEELQRKEKHRKKGHRNRQRRRRQ